MTRVWRDGNTGQGVTVALVDDGAVGAVSASGTDWRTELRPDLLLTPLGSG